MPFGVIFTELSSVKDSWIFQKKRTWAFFLQFLIVFKCKTKILIIYQLTHISYHFKANWIIKSKQTLIGLFDCNITLELWGLSLVVCSVFWKPCIIFGLENWHFQHDLTLTDYLKWLCVFLCKVLAQIEEPSVTQIF